MNVYHRHTFFPLVATQQICLFKVHTQWAGNTGLLLGKGLGSEFKTRNGMDWNGPDIAHSIDYSLLQEPWMVILQERITPSHMSESGLSSFKNGLE